MAPQHMMALHEGTASIHANIQHLCFVHNASWTSKHAHFGKKSFFLQTCAIVNTVIPSSILHVLGINIFIRKHSRKMIVGIANGHLLRYKN